MKRSKGELREGSEKGDKNQLTKNKNKIRGCEGHEL